MVATEAHLNRRLARPSRQVRYTSHKRMDFRMARRRRSLFVLPLIVFACSIAGGIYGPKLEVASAATESEDPDLNVRNFSKVLSLVEANFADKVSPDKTVYKGAIPGMLRTLDPHSNFFDAHEYRSEEHTSELQS